MPKSKNAVASRQRRKKVMNQTKGQFGRRKNVWTVSKNAYEKGLTYAYRDRRKKKINFRALWIQRINAAAREYGLSYSRMINGLKIQNIEIDRRVLADLAVNEKEAFAALAEKAKESLQAA
jgi:large subunit ribosomal protein L20